MQKIKNFIFNILTLIFTLLIMFVVVEAGFKVLHFFSDAEVSPTNIEGLPYENTPNGWFLRYSQVSGWVFYKHNSLGMRDLERSFEKPNNKRILVLGDSVMYGGEVKFNDIFSRQLESLFNKDNIEVLNCGTTSYSLNEYPVYLKEKGIKFSPDLVIVGLCLNDYKTLFHQKEKPKKETKDTDIKEQKKTKSVLFQKIKRLFHSYFLDYLKSAYNALITKKQKFAYGEVYTKDVWENNRSYFKALKDISNSVGADLIILILPSGHQFEVEDVRNIPQKYIIDICNSLDIRCVNPFFSFEQALKNGEMIYKNDYTHFSGKGHQICAEEVFAYIKKNKLLQ